RTSASPLPSLEEGDLRLISRDLDGHSPWLDPNRAVSLGHIVQAATAVGRAPEEVATRLTALGYRTPASPLPSLEEGDLRLISQNLIEGAPWLDPGRPVHPAHIIHAASRTGSTIDHTTTRLSALSYRVPAIRGSFPEPDDLLLISVDLDSKAPWLDPNDPVHPAHILQAARTTARTPRAVITRLAELGYRLPNSITLDTEAHAPEPPATARTQPVPLRKVSRKQVKVPSGRRSSPPPTGAPSEAHS
ncbi:hypothetical protein, partial [Streptomyces albogriseolus]|uniref:wHTH domain-containing protein n=1 Tax=Streptomyces albogriseolus TaxID=1887 RepID=UPI003CEEFE4C